MGWRRGIINILIKGGKEIKGITRQSTHRAVFAFHWLAGKNIILLFKMIQERGLTAAQGEALDRWRNRGRPVLALARNPFLRTGFAVGTALLAMQGAQVYFKSQGNHAAADSVHEIRRQLSEYGYNWRNIPLFLVFIAGAAAHHQYGIIKVFLERHSKWGHMGVMNSRAFENRIRQSQRQVSGTARRSSDRPYLGKRQFVVFVDTRALHFINDVFGYIKAGDPAIKATIEAAQVPENLRHHAVVGNGDEICALGVFDDENHVQETLKKIEDAMLIRYMRMNEAQFVFQPHNKKMLETYGGQKEYSNVWQYHANDIPVPVLFGKYGYAEVKPGTNPQDILSEAMKIKEGKERFGIMPLGELKMKCQDILYRNPSFGPEEHIVRKLGLKT